jgi:hypothetical protein
MAAAVALFTPTAKVPYPPPRSCWQGGVLLPRGCAAPSTTPAFHDATQAPSTDSEMIARISSTMRNRFRVHPLRDHTPLRVALRHSSRSIAPTLRFWLKPTLLRAAAFGTVEMLKPLPVALCTESIVFRRWWSRDAPSCPFRAASSSSPVRLGGLPPLFLGASDTSRSAILAYRLRQESLTSDRLAALDTWTSHVGAP